MATASISIEEVGRIQMQWGKRALYALIGLCLAILAILPMWRTIFSLGYFALKGNHSVVDHFRVTVPKWYFPNVIGQGLFMTAGSRFSPGRNIWFTPVRGRTASYAEFRKSILDRNHVNADALQADLQLNTPAGNASCFELYRRMDLVEDHCWWSTEPLMATYVGPPTHKREFYDSVGSLTKLPQ